MVSSRRKTQETPALLPVIVKGYRVETGAEWGWGVGVALGEVGRGWLSLRFSAWDPPMLQMAWDVSNSQPSGFLDE